MKAPSYHSDPHVTYLSQLLDEIGSGIIQVPKFQRPLVWQWEARLELFRSIRDGIPMGAIMVWRSSVPVLDCYKFLGPHRLDSPSSSPQYLLDGVQRLSTLLGALSSVDVVDTNDEEFLEADGGPPTENFSVHYDFEAKDFLRAEDVKSSNKNVTLPMSLMFDSVGMLRFQRNLKGDEETIDSMVRSCDDLVAAFREYKVPVIPIVTDDIAMATRTFQRLNSQGEAMSEVHMIHALSWDSKFNLNARIHEAKIAALNDLGWADLNDDIVFKSCKVALGFGVYSKSVDELGAAFKTGASTVSDVGQACGRAIDFLIEQCGISRFDLLPYAFQLVLLTEAFRLNPVLDVDQKRDLVSWFWTTTYGEYFAGMSGDRVEKARQDLLRGLETRQWTLTQFDPFEVRELTRRFDFRSVRAKAFSLRLSDVAGDDLRLVSGRSLLREFGRECLVQLLPRSSAHKSIYSSYANRFIINPKNTNSFKDKARTGDFSAAEMRNLLISSDMVEALKRDDHDEFVNLRSEKIALTERDFYGPHVRKMGLLV